MDYTKIHIAKKVLEVAGLPIPDDEKEIRKKAYECLINKDFLAAHQIRLGRIGLLLQRETGKTS